MRAIICETIAAPGESNRAWGVDGAFGFNDEASLVTYYARSHTPRLAGNDQLGRLSRLRLRRVPLTALNIPKR